MVEYSLFNILFTHQKLFLASMSYHVVQYIINKSIKIKLGEGEDSMTNMEIKEFKKFVREILVKKYHMNEIEAQRAVRDSYMSKALARDKDYVEHDTVEEWADFIYDEVNKNNLLMM